MTEPISQHPERRIGVYKQLADVPEHHRLAQYEESFEGKDVWSEHVAAQSNAFDSDHYHATFRKAGRSWKNHLTDRGRHHALATPHDVETWVTSLAETRLLRTVRTEYWIRVEEFYSWLQFHTEYPHVYHPVLMAASHYGTARAVWMTKFEGRDGNGGGSA